MCDSVNDSASFPLTSFQRAESWHHLPQERDSSQTLDTPQTEIDVRREGMKVIDFPSLEKSELAQSERPVMKPKLNLLCSPLLGNACVLLIPFYFMCMGVLPAYMSVHHVRAWCPW